MGEQDSLPYIGQLTGVVLDGEESLYIDSEDFTSAFNLFAVPDAWPPFRLLEKWVLWTLAKSSSTNWTWPAMLI